MSRETMQWLAENTLTGFVGERGPAWHAAVGDANQFDGPVPLDNVNQLFAWEAVESDLYVVVDGENVAVPGRKAIVRSDDPATVLHLPTTSYAIHQYAPWLVENVAKLLDESTGELMIGSAGLLQNGGQAWVQIRPNDGITVGGDQLVPWLLATTSHNGTIATQYRPVMTRVVCDNTLAMSLGERSKTWRAKHTSRSGLRIAAARDAIGLMFEASKAFEADVDQLMNTVVTDDQWNKMLDTLMPEKREGVDATSARQATTSRENRFRIQHLWNYDTRVAPFAGTAWGVLQAFNTYGHWQMQPSTRTIDRQLTRTIKGEVEANDQLVLDTLNAVLVG